MRYSKIILFVIISQFNLNAQSDDSFRFAYLTEFIDRIDKVFSKITESETKKKLKRECIYLISDVDELQIEAEILLQMYTQDTASYWLSNRKEYSEQLEIVYEKNRSINNRVQKIRAKYFDSFDEIGLDGIENIRTELSYRSAAIDYVEKFLRKENLSESDKYEILEKLINIDSKAKGILKEANNLRKRVLDKI